MKPGLAWYAANIMVAALGYGSVSAEAPPPADATDAHQDGSHPEVVVLGFGQGRQEQTIGQADIARLTPGSTPFKAIEKLPGVQYQAADPFGAYEWALRISLRGFNQNQLGFTLDDVPLGDMSYGNVNGLHVSRAIIAENLGRVVVAQGAGAPGTASTSNLGGTLQFYSDDPRPTFGIAASATGGSDSSYRGYVRVDSGAFGALRGSLSYAYLHADKWRGEGPQYQHQVNAKLVADLGDTGTLAGFFDASVRRETDYQDLTLDLIRRVGWDRAYRIDNVRPDYALAKRIALALQTGTAFPAPYTNPDDVYYDAGGLRNDYLAGANLDLTLAPGVALKLTPYYHWDKGQGSWFTPFVPTPLGAPDRDGDPILNPAPLSFRTTEYALHRGGMTGALQWDSGINQLRIGGWYEHNRFDQARRYYGLADDAPGRATLAFQHHPFFTQFDGRYLTDTYQYHVEDKITLIDGRLTLSGGWKGVRVDNQAQDVTAPLASGRIHARDWFQPQASIVYRVTPSTEIFADYTENMRAFVSAFTTGPFSTTQQGFDAIRTSLKPETSKTYEGGARYHDGPFQASAVGYYVDFANRLAPFANGTGIVGNPAILNNVGSVHAWGAELTASYRATQAISLFADYSLNHSVYQDDVLLADGTVFARTKGKTVADAPRHMLKGELVYDDGRVFGRIGGDYMSKRYFSYEDDLVARGRLTADASIGYRLAGSGWAQGVSIELSVTNLTDKKYIATVNTNNIQVSGSDFDNPNFMLGVPRQWFLTLKKGF